MLGPVTKLRCALLAGAFMALIATVGCAEDAPVAKPTPKPAREVGPAATEVGPPDTNPLEKIDDAAIGPLPDAYCAAFREADDKYGPLNLPRVTIDTYPDVIRLVVIMYDNAPPTLKTRMEYAVGVLKSLNAAIADGTVRNPETFNAWADKNVGKDQAKKFFTSYFSLLNYSSQTCLR